MRQMHSCLALVDPFRSSVSLALRAELIEVVAVTAREGEQAAAMKSQLELEAVMQLGAVKAVDIAEMKQGQERAQSLL